MIRAYYFNMMLDRDIFWFVHDSIVSTQCWHFMESENSRDYWFLSDAATAVLVANISAVTEQFLRSEAYWQIVQKGTQFCISGIILPHFELSIQTYSILKQAGEITSRVVLTFKGCRTECSISNFISVRVQEFQQSARFQAWALIVGLHRVFSIETEHGRVIIFSDRKIRPAHTTGTDKLTNDAGLQFNRCLCRQHLSQLESSLVIRLKRPIESWEQSECTFQF